MCGQIEYSVRAVSYTENTVTPLVVLQGTSIILQPSPAFSPGVYVLQLVGTLVDYPHIAGAERFTVKVTDCASTLITSGLSGSVSHSNNWYTPDAGVSFLNLVNQLDQEPNCNFGYTYELWEVTPSGDLLPPPPEVSLDQNYGVLYVEKCASPDSTDPACAGAPYGASFDLVLRACLNDGKLGTPEMQFADIPVRAELGTPCSGNEVSFDNTLSVIDYVISSPGEPFEYAPTLLAKYEFCPVDCRLVEMPGELDYNTEVVQAWTPSDVTAVFRTSNKAFHGRAMDLQIQCRALEAPESSALSYAATDFQVRFTDACTQSVLTPPSMSDYDVPLFTTDIRPFVESTN